MSKNNINYKILEFKPIVTEGKPGELIDLNLNNICLKNNIEFNISKCFYINELNSPLSRGNHSNNNASEILVCLNGSFEIKLNNGKNEINLQINKNEGIYIDKNIWIEFYNFDNCIIIVFVNIYVDNKQSCYDFNEFLLNNA